MKYLIVGNGIAGKTAARVIRKYENDADITIVTDSGNRFFFRPDIIESFGNNVEFEGIVSRTDEDYDPTVTLVVEKKVVQIDDVKNQVILDDNEILLYDKLLIATGNEVDYPKIKRIEASDVFGLSKIDDFVYFKSKIDSYSKITVIGGGLLGVEISSVLNEMGKSVKLVECKKQLMKRQLDWHASELLMSTLIKNGIEVITNENVNEITEDENSIKSLKFDSGIELSCDAVIIATGVRFNNEILGKSKILSEKRILVNDILQTSVKNIFCAGDAASHRGVIYGNWLAAKEQGEIAGMIMSGQDTEYKGSVNEYRLKLKNFELYCAGSTVNSVGEALIAKEGCIYRKLIIADDKPVGVIVLNDPFTASIAEEVFKGYKSVVSLKKYF